VKYLTKIGAKLVQKHIDPEVPFLLMFLLRLPISLIVLTKTQATLNISAPDAGRPTGLGYIAEMVITKGPYLCHYIKECEKDAG
jgi:hypothetical protein